MKERREPDPQELREIAKIDPEFAEAYAKDFSDLPELTASNRALFREHMLNLAACPSNVPTTRTMRGTRLRFVSRIKCSFQTGVCHT